MGVNLQMCTSCMEEVQYSISICGFTLVECENPRGEWLLLSCVPVGHMAVCSAFTRRQAAYIFVNSFKCKTGLQSMSEGGNGILIMLAYIRIVFLQIWIIVNLLISYVAAKLNHKARLKILPPLSHHYAICDCAMTFYACVCTAGKILHWIWSGLDLYQTVQMFVFLLYPNVRCFVTRLENLTCSFINLLTNGRDADFSLTKYNSWQDMTCKFSRAFGLRFKDCTSVNLLYNSDSSSTMDRGGRAPQFIRVCIRFISLDWNKLLPYIFKEAF